MLQQLYNNIRPKMNFYNITLSNNVTIDSINVLRRLAPLAVTVGVKNVVTN